MTAESSASSSGLTIAIVFWEGWLGVAPSLINAIRMLREHGYRVDVFLGPQTGARHASPPPFEDGVAVHMFASAGLSPAGTPVSLPRRPNRVAFIHWVWQRTKGRRYMCVIGVDAMGLIGASLVARRVKRPVIYWSLELPNDRPSARTFDRVLAWLEGALHRRAQMTIVPGEERALALARVHSATLPQRFIVPNSARAIMEERASGPPQRVLHSRLGLNPVHPLILHAGIADPCTHSLELATGAALWPRDWTLVFHEREHRSATDPYLERLVLAGQGRVRLSLTPVPYDELDAIIASADVGIAFYDQSRGDNFALMGGSSGKAAHYLRCGVPLICQSGSGLSHMVERYQCGAVVDDPGDTASAVAGVLGDLPRMRENARACFREELEFGSRFDVVIKAIDQFANPP